MFAFTASIDNFSYTQDAYAKSKKYKKSKKRRTRKKKSKAKAKRKAKPKASGAVLTKIEMTTESLDKAWKDRKKYKKLYVQFGEAKAKVPEDFEIAWRVGRAIYYAGWFCLPKKYDNDKKIAFWKYGVDAADKAAKLKPNRVEGHYWYAAAYGGYGTSKGIRASLGGAPGMRDALTKAIKIDPTYHFAGPYRIRGRLYFKLPGFISFGDNEKALEDLKKAVELGKNCKLNYIYLAEVQAKEETDEAALKTLSSAKKLPSVGGALEEKSWMRDLIRTEKDIMD
jgi:tetratricopeptide (TPR) repeat protein